MSSSDINNAPMSKKTVKKTIIRNRRRKTIRCHKESNESTQKLYAMAVDRFFEGCNDKDEQFRVLSAKEEKALIKRYRNNRAEMENQLVAHNIFLAIGYANTQQYRFRDFGELISLAMYGLREGAATFDPKKKCRFCTHALWHIKRHVLKPFYVKKEYYISNNTSIYIDDTKTVDRGDNESDYVFGTINSQIEPSLAEDYEKNNTLVKVEDNEHEARMKNILDKIMSTVATSSLSSTDKDIFNRAFIEHESVSKISDGLGISNNEVLKGKKRVLSFINANFSKEEVFAA